MEHVKPKSSLYTTHKPRRMHMNVDARTLHKCVGQIFCDGHLLQMMLMLDKHHEFERAAAALQAAGGRRYIETTPRGVDQHVVELRCAVLRWPLHYGGEATPQVAKPKPNKVRYESLFYQVDDTREESQPGL